MKKKKFNLLLNIFVILIVLIIVLYFSLKDNYQEILTAIFNMNLGWFLGAIILLFIYRLFTSLGHYLIIQANHEQVSFKRIFQINFIILFFHGVTPFAGGGQPMEIYYLHKEKIPVTKATNITLQNFIVYQISLVLIGVFALVCNNIIDLFPNNSLIKKLVILGFIINSLVLILTFILSFGKKINKWLCNFSIHFLSKFHLIKDEQQYKQKFQEYLIKFHQNALQLKNNKITVLKSIICNILGLIIFYSIPYTIAKGMTLDISLLYTVVATAYVMIIGSFVPIPGGTGGIEYGFMFFFGYFITGNLLNAIMLVWRFVSYYLGMVFGAIALSLYRKKEKICE